MRRFINWLLFLLALALAALGAAAQLALIHIPFPPLAFGAAAAVFAALLIIRGLPLRARRPVVFLVALALLAALTGGLAYFQFVIKPVMVKGFITAAFAPKPTTVTAEAARVEQWRPELTAIGTLRAYPGRRHRAASRRRRDGDPFRIGRRRRSRRAPHQHRRFGRAGRPRQRPRATEERRGRRSRAKGRSSPRAIPPNRQSTRRSRPATRPPRQLSARAPSSPRRRSRRLSPAGSACATSILGNMSRWERAS